MIFEMKLIEFKNPLNRTYSNKPCGGTYGPNGELLNSNEIFSNTTLKYAEDKECQTGFLFCLVDLPFRNPQNCSLGDYTTPVLGTNHIVFSPNASHNFTYKFTINKLPSVTSILLFLNFIGKMSLKSSNSRIFQQGFGMMIEVRDYFVKTRWEPIDFYTSALADVPLSIKSSNSTYTVKKRFSSLFNHNSSLLVQSKVNNYFFSSFNFSFL